MEFTYLAYEKLLNRLRDGLYDLADYHDWSQYSRPVILRHDIDYDITKSVQLATVEKNVGAKSTYFVMLTSDFYNVFSKESYSGLMKILDCGHDIGLHFDEVRYSDCEGVPERVVEHILDEIKALEAALGKTVDVVSMHRPSKGLLEAEIEIPGVINSYSQTFFKEFKYLSDSRRRWREPVEEIIESKEYDRIHILTHAFWYSDEERDILDTIRCFINSGNECRYGWMSSNITDLESIMKQEEIVGMQPWK